MTIRASICLAAISGILGLFSMGSAHADSRVGAALKTIAPIENIVTKTGFEHESDSYSDGYCRNRSAEHKRCYYKRWRRHHHRYSRRYHERHKCCRGYARKRHHRRRHYPRPRYGRNYEIYTYKPPITGSRHQAQLIYGWYRGYYHPYPRYPGVQRYFNY
jgi:hypothetical protein